MPRRNKTNRSSDSRSGDDRERNALLQRGIGFQQQGRLKDAEHCYQLVLRAAPGDPDANNLIGTLAIEADAYDVAITYFRKALKHRPKDPDIRNNLGNAYVLALEPGEALPHLRKALKARPGFLEAIINLANAYKQLGRAAQAKKHYEQAIRLEPERPSAIIGYGEVLAELGLMDEAAEAFRKAIENNIYIAKAFQQLTTVRKLEPTDPEFDRLYELLDDPGLDEDERMSLHHSAGKVQASLKNHDRAFHHFQRAKRMSDTTFDMADHRRTYDRIISLFNAGFFLSRQDYGVSSERPVFIVGMPRSGTTLTEQIVASHPDVFGAGELPELRHLVESVSGGALQGDRFVGEMSDMTPERSRQLAEQYLDILKKHSLKAARVTDKLPHNYELLGFIALLFPNAKVIHCRRDPIDTCVSCFTHQFSDFHGYNGDLTQLGLYYREYERLMRHWENVLPIRIFENRYEDMTSDQEQQTRRLIDYLGLDWDDRCLAFYETERLVQTPSRWQVRQPIYRSSVKGWKKYENHLGPLIEALGGTEPEATR